MMGKKLELPGIDGMDAKTWESALNKASSLGLLCLVTLPYKADSHPEFGMRVGTETIRFKAPMLNEIEPAAPNVKNKAKLIDGFARFLQENDTEASACYEALEKVFSLDDRYTYVVDGEDFRSSDRSRSHFHICGSTGEKYRTVHDEVKGIRDGSVFEDEEWLSCKHEENSFKEDYDEWCSHCGQESHGQLDMRIGLIDRCSECGEPILICSMCDNAAQGCIDCPERHLKCLYPKIEN